MKESLRREIEELVKILNLNCSVREFKNKVSWRGIGLNRIQLSTDFIREFKKYVYWGNISTYQHLSEDDIIEFQDYVDWKNISHHQNHLSEKFLWENRDKINWSYIVAPSINRDFSEDFIYDMWIYLGKSAFRRIFLNYYKITEERLRELYKRHKIHNRWEILDL